MHLETYVFWGQVLNPYNTNLTPGGSSGGCSVGSVIQPGADSILSTFGPLYQSLWDVDLWFSVILESKSWLHEYSVMQLLWHILFPRPGQIRVMWHDSLYCLNRRSDRHEYTADNIRSILWTAEFGNQASRGLNGHNSADCQDPHDSRALGDESPKRGTVPIFLALYRSLLTSFYVPLEPVPLQSSGRANTGGIYSDLILDMADGPRPWMSEADMYDTQNCCETYLTTDDQEISTHQLPGLGNDCDDDEKQSVHSSASMAINDLHHIEELWFEDDTLILRAEDSLFRVSKGVLSAQSPVMKAMLSGIPKAGGTIMYGCPVVELHHSASDVTCFLKAVFDSDFFLPPPAKSSIWVVNGVIQLAHEYNVHPLLSSEPTDVHCNLLALQVALEVGTLWNFPRIIYECCTSSLTDILDSEGWEDLPVIHKRTIILSHDTQKHRTSVVSQFLLEDVSRQCRSILQCSSAKLRWLKIVDNWHMENCDSFPLEFWEASNWEDMGHYFCHSCLVQSKEHHELQRCLLWNVLPRAFGLPSWNELEMMKTEMFGAN
ncbi:hypothetical protein B0H10DRAFT_2251221 [Mycena sp. CBHHK59/15]|nr:hypothetical protein B0H10DRAFT_2251221 [Mycena sp. CBHHK59/15]